MVFETSALLQGMEATRVSPAARAMVKARKARTMALADLEWEAPQLATRV